ncbi:MAG: hypothetical protein A2075_06345 [Geobacteraceae bacterium GWC2_58_44]|nr:MAG: hypothetical protein A2075_06345 [Geobacteraceae bacterium GWC2_58_44]HBG06104.1 hypothetical protein [Geobacter sp.]
MRVLTYCCKGIILNQAVLCHKKAQNSHKKTNKTRMTVDTDERSDRAKAQGGRQLNSKDAKNTRLSFNAETQRRGDAEKEGVI